MDIIRSLEWRYATKKFDPSKKLTTASLEVLKKAFNLTATSYGLQPLKMLVIENPALRQELLTYAYQQRQVVEASHLLVICIEKETSTEDIHAHFDLEKSVRDSISELGKLVEVIEKPFLIEDLEAMINQTSILEKLKNINNSHQKSNVEKIDEGILLLANQN